MSNPTKKVLIIEDSRDLSDIVSRMLQQNYDTLALYRLENGLKECKTYKPDIILLDIILPGEIDGFSFLRMIKHNIDLCHIPVILMSSMAEEETILEGLNYGANDYLIKPFNMSQLLLKIKNLLEISELSQKRGMLNTIPQFSFDDAKNYVLLEQMNTFFEEIINGDKQTSMESLAEELSISQSKLQRLSKSHYGMPPIPYILKRKMEKAKIILSADKSVAVKEVAYSLGFASMAYFSKCYKTYNGISPTTIRKLQGKKSEN